MELDPVATLLRSVPEAGSMLDVPFVVADWRLERGKSK
jgi:hypothetical protein